MADPLLKEPKHVFPTSQDDIDHVCRVIFPQTWSEFIACIKSFTATCLSNSQRSDFNRAVGDSINSVHKMCTNEDYKGDYLKNADCIMEKAMDEGSCKKYYNKLVTHIQEGTKSTEDLCCAHDSFKNCVIEETKECPCDQDWCQDQTQTASHFAKIIMDNALGFLLKQCNSASVATLANCNGYIPKRPRFDNPQTVAEEDAEPGYFPSGPSRTNPLLGDSEASGSRVVTNDPRSPKEVTEDSFGFDNGAGLDNPDHLNQITPTSSEIPRSRDLDEEERLQSARNDLEAWLAESDITDFDEFLRKTLRTGASTQLYGRGTNGSSLKASSSLKHAIPSVLTIFLYKLLFNT